ncbi:MAG: mannose-6-phosphate isomerase, partial [Bacteroidetes bacterium]
FETKYKTGFFVDWRVCDRLKKKLMNKWDYVLDTNIKNQPKMATAYAIREGMEQAVSQPFSVVPFFDPGIWGGQWMREVCDLPKEPDNYAWCINCIPEENSIYLGFGDINFEIPSINVVFAKPVKLLGDPVHARFGDEFPIRFDFLDTMDGGNLSLQVHPLTEYIQENFGIHYTQDESYYILDAKEDASVYLGLKEGVDNDKMISELENAERNGICFEAENHVNKWPAKKHDHFLIPGGTVHCSGKNSMVLEISATPYIFTFKLWDWGRINSDGKPRPINIKHGKNVIQWNRTTNWVKEQLINRVVKIGEGDGWIEEKTGLHEREFIETRRHWFTKTVLHKTNGSVNVLVLIEGREAIVESPSNKFEPFVVHYAETFIVPDNVKEYTIRPYGESQGKKIATIKAYIRF